MGDDEIEWRLWECCRITSESIGVHKANLRAGGKPPRGLTKHLRARIDRHDLNVRDSPRQFCKKTAVAVAVDKSAPARDHILHP